MTALQSHRRLGEAARAGQSPAVAGAPSPEVVAAAPRILSLAAFEANDAAHLRGSASVGSRLFSRSGSRQAGQGRPASSASARASSHASIIRPAMSPILSMSGQSHGDAAGVLSNYPREMHHDQAA